MASPYRPYVSGSSQNVLHKFVLLPCHYAWSSSRSPHSSVKENSPGWVGVCIIPDLCHHHPTPLWRRTVPNWVGTKTFNAPLEVVALLCLRAWNFCVSTCTKFLRLGHAWNYCLWTNSSRWPCAVPCTVHEVITVFLLRGAKYQLTALCPVFFWERTWWKGHGQSGLGFREAGLVLGEPCFSSYAWLGLENRLLTL